MANKRIREAPEFMDYLRSLEGNDFNLNNYNSNDKEMVKLRRMLSKNNKNKKNISVRERNRLNTTYLPRKSHRFYINRDPVDAYLKNNRKTHAQFSDSIGFSRTWISQILSGKGIQIEAIRMISEVTGIPQKELIYAPAVKGMFRDDFIEQEKIKEKEGILS